MSKLALLSFIVLGACATTGLPGQPEHGRDAPHTGVRLDLTGAPETADAVFPTITDPKVPSVDRMAHALRARYGTAELTAELDLCIAPDGHVTKLGLAKTSTYEAFDHALLRDVADWQFSSLPGPANVESCRKATIAYRTR